MSDANGYTLDDKRPFSATGRTTNPLSVKAESATCVPPTTSWRNCNSDLRMTSGWWRCHEGVTGNGSYLGVWCRLNRPPRRMQRLV